MVKFAKFHIRFVPEHVLVVDLEEPHGPGADDEVGHVDEHVEEQEPRAAPHSAPFPEMNSATFLAVNSKKVISHLYAYWLPSDDNGCIEEEVGPEVCSVKTRALFGR